MVLDEVAMARVPTAPTLVPAVLFLINTAVAPTTTTMVNMKVDVRVT
jgi:hypothetical protein